MAYLEDNPTVAEQLGEKVKAKIVRLAPFIDGIEIEFRKYNIKGVYSKLRVTELETKKCVFEKTEYCHLEVMKAEGLSPNRDYVAEIIIYDGKMEEIARTTPRLFRCGFFPGKVVDYIHPSDVTYMRSGEFIGSPHIVKTETGSYIASHDIFAHGENVGHQTLCRFFVSKNYGETWNYISEIERCTWGSMFRRGKTLYIVGTTENPNGGGDVVMHYSDDEAISWSEPVILARKTKTKVFRTSPTASVIHNNRIWFYLTTYIDDDAALGTLSADLDGDLKDPANWVVSEEQKYNSDWEDVVPKWSPIMMEEGNMVVSPEGELKIIIRYNSHRYDTPVVNPENVRALMFKVNPDNPKGKVEFEKAIPFNGGLHKFYLQYDGSAQRYLGLVNRITTEQIWQRNVLSLVSSKDLYKWQVERDLVNLEDIGLSEDAWKCAVQYPSFLLDNDEVVAVVRTAINNADNFHNSNAMTFHRFKDITDKYRF